MPFYLKEVDIVSEVARFRSALIVPCRFCPAASLAVRRAQPFIKFFGKLLRTQCYEESVKNLQSRLRAAGVKTEVFGSSILNYVLCMWPAWKRKKLAKCASEYEAVVVLGCEGAYEGVAKMIHLADCQVFRGMESEGTFAVTPRFNWPCNISLELFGVTQMHGAKVE